MQEAIAREEVVRFDPAAASAAAPCGVELSVVVPTFNERENVALLINRLATCLEHVSWEVIVVDDDSPDGTADLVRAIGRRGARVRCPQRLGRRGLSSACIEGMLLASSAPYLAVIDADLQHDEALLPRMLETLRDGEADIVVGSRYAAGGGLGAWDPRRAAISRFAARLGRPVLRGVDGLTDPMSGFFMIRREAFEATVRRLSGIGFKLLVDLFASTPRPLRFKELPYGFRVRRAGESKLDGQAAWDYGILLLDKLAGGLIPVRFIAFALVGGLGVVVHLLVLVLLLDDALGVGFIAGHSAATLAAMTSNFTLNNALTYRDRRLTGWRGWLRGWATFTLACSVGALANVGIAAYLFEEMGTFWLVSALAGIAVGAVWNYAVTSVCTWRTPRPG